MKKYTVITPCYNAENHIRETISSITGQSAFVKGIAKLEYIICDGGSTDRTIQVAETMLDRAPNCSHRIISEPDNGMYDALVKGLKTATGDYCSYLNAGDLCSGFF